MTYYDTHLRAADEAALDAALQAAGLLEPIGEDAQLIPAKGVTLDRIGAITQVLGYESDGETPITQVFPEYHANLRTNFVLSSEQQDAMVDIIIPAPDSPHRVWAS